MTEAERIDPADLRTALGTCMHDKDLQRLFKCAPDGAKKVLKLSFYSTVFPEKIDGHKFRVNLRAIEPELTAEDLQYLIRFETDAQLKAHFSELLAGLASDGSVASAGMPDLDQSGPKLRIIRPTGGAGVDLNAEAMKRRMTEAEEEKAEECSKAAQACRKAFRDRALRGAFVSVIALVVLGCGIGWYLRWDAEKKEKVRQEKLREAEVRQAAEREQAEAEKVRQKQAEAERVKREEQTRQTEAKREAERQKRLAEEAKLKTERELRQKAEADLAARTKALAEEFDRVESFFRKAKLLAWSALPKAKRPGAADGTFYCAVPVGRNERDVFKIESKAGGEIRVSRLSRKDEPAAIDLNEWKDKLEAAGGIVCDGSDIYFLQPKAGAEGLPLPKSDFNPSQLRLGELAAMMNSFGLVSDQMATEVLVSVGKAKGQSAKFTVKFNDYLGLYEVKEALRKVIDASTPRASYKPKRRTAMFYDGNVLKKQMNGVVLVPRSPLHVDAKYADYCAEAERQEYEEKRGAREAEDKRREEIERRLTRALESAKLAISVVL